MPSAGQAMGRRIHCDSSQERDRGQQLDEIVFPEKESGADREERNEQKATDKKGARAALPMPQKCRRTHTCNDPHPKGGADHTGEILRKNSESKGSRDF